MTGINRNLMRGGGSKRSLCYFKCSKAPKGLYFHFSVGVNAFTGGRFCDSHFLVFSLLRYFLLSLGFSYLKVYLENFAFCSCVPRWLVSTTTRKIAPRRFSASFPPTSLLNSLFHSPSKALYFGKSCFHYNSLFRLNGILCW
jgi:hypothetical protein